ncbi:unnamed protein product [Ilex paraguariensis]|uniref:RRM domain-containing protein n=1 Tax=Ilex paraguariensis TaxID=185542 RepID=A0ABC8T228_9AQUA
MPPRNRRAKKLTPKSKKLADIDSTSLAAADDDITMAEPENKDQGPPLEETFSPQEENVLAEAKIKDSYKVEHPVIAAEKEIKQEDDDVLAEELITHNERDVMAEAEIRGSDEVVQPVIEEEKGIKQEYEVLAESTITPQEGNLLAERKSRDSDEVLQPLIAAEKEIKQEIEVLDANLMSIEGLAGGAHDKAVEKVKPQEGEVGDVVVEDDVNAENRVVVEGLGIVKEERERMEGVGDKSDNVNALEMLGRGTNVAEEKGVERELNEEGGSVANDGAQLGIIPVAEQNYAEEDTAAAQINVAKAPMGGLAVDEAHTGKRDEEGSDGDEKNSEDSEDDNEGSDEADPTVFMHDPLTVRKKHRSLEIYVGRLDKGAVEEDLKNVFGKFGEIKDVRIVRNSTTNKSKGFAFVRYATVEQAKNALTELKDGIEVRGKHVKISASQDNDTLYVGNICKKWKKEDVFEKFKSYGIEHIEELHLPDGPKNGGRIKGYALLEFNTHSDAMVAFHRLRKPDAVFGHNRSAKVAFTRASMHPNEEVLSQVKSVYIEGLTDAWNEDKVKEICKQYGDVTEIKLSQNLGTKRKDFGFITFTSRGSALACVEGINNANIGEELKVKASMAKPHSKGRLQKQGFRGGFQVKRKSKVPSPEKESDRDGANGQAGLSQMTGHGKSNQPKRKQQAIAVEKGKSLSELKTAEGGKPNKPHSITEGQRIGAPSKLEKTNRKRKSLPSEGQNHGSGRPSKKSKGNRHGRQNEMSKTPKRGNHVGKRPEYAAFTGYSQGHTYSAVSASKRHCTDMEPHAGYIEPVAGKHGGRRVGYPEPSHAKYFEPAGGAHNQPHAGYLQPAVGARGRAHAGYFERTVPIQVQIYGGYLEPAVVTRGQPHTAYLQPAVGNHAHHLYDPGLRRAVGHDGQGSHGSGVRRVSPAGRPAYTHTTYTSYTGYQDGAHGGGYHQSSGVFLPRRVYH